MANATAVEREIAGLALQALFLRNGAVLADCGPLSDLPSRESRGVHAERQSPGSIPGRPLGESTGVEEEKKQPLRVVK